MSDTYEIDIQNTVLQVGIPGASGTMTMASAATYAAAQLLTLTTGQLVRVAVDETNNGDRTIYLYNGTSLEYHYTVPNI